MMISTVRFNGLSLLAVGFKPLAGFRKDELTGLLVKRNSQVCTENSSGSIPQFTQQIASCADVTFGGTRSA